MRICTITFAAVITGIVLGALFVFNGSATHTSAPVKTYVTVSVSVLYGTTPAELDEPKEEPPACAASIPTHIWSAV